MSSGGPVGTTLKLDYWDERCQTGALFPTLTGETLREKLLRVGELVHQNHVA